MNPNEVVRYKTMLDIKHAELVAAQHSPEGLAVERVADEMDEIVFANQRDLMVDALNRQACLLAQVVDALRRLGDGSYGECSQCGERISSKRLNALPWAAFCLKCQEIADDRANPADGRSLPHAA